MTGQRFPVEQNAMDLNVSIQTLAFSVTLPEIFGSNVNHLLNIFGPLTSGLTLTDETGIFYLGETYDIGGSSYEMIGSGTAVPGISILGLVVPLGMPVDVMIMRNSSTGQYTFIYPNGTPNLLSAIALVTNTSAQPYSADFAGAPPVCFCLGTLIETETGLKPVELIRPGERVKTAAGGALKVLWAGGRDHSSLDGPLAPVTFEAGSLGPGLPARPLRLSPNHRVMLGAKGAETWLGPAKAFVGLAGISQDEVSGPVGYYHLLLERHAVVYAEGVAVESLLLGDQARVLLGEAVMDQIAGQIGCRVEELGQRPEAEPCGHLLGARKTRRAIERRLGRGFAPAGMRAITERAGAVA